MSDFVESLGLAFFAHRLRRLSEQLVEGCGDWLHRTGVVVPPKAGSTMLLLREAGPLSVTQIAQRLKLSHPLIIGLTRELEAMGLVRIDQDPTDRRRRPVTLTAQGAAQAERIANVNRFIAQAYQDLFADAGVDGLAVVARLERAIGARTMSSRLERLAAGNRQAASGRTEHA